MTEEIENSKSSHACLSSETHAYEYEVEFIKTYEQQPILWDVKHPDYTNKYKRGFAMDILLKIINKWDNNATRYSVRQKINILRSCYRKDLRKYLASKTIGPDGEKIYLYNPKSWKFKALKFLGGLGDENIEHKNNNSVEELNLDTSIFEVDAGVDSDKDESLSRTRDILQNSCEDKIYKLRRKNKNLNDQNRKKRKHVKLDLQDYFIDEDIHDREFEATGSNVVCKLKRMNPEQRCHAELLINKVLIAGLKNNLTDHTDLTEVYK